MALPLPQARAAGKQKRLFCARFSASTPYLSRVDHWQAAWQAFSDGMSEVLDDSRRRERFETAVGLLRAVPSSPAALKQADAITMLMSLRVAHNAEPYLQPAAAIRDEFEAQVRGA